MRIAPRAHAVATTMLYIILALQSSCAVGILLYGHAYEAPGDFSPAQYAFIAANFPLFTIEKRHAYGVYGVSSAPAPRRYNSIAASVGTARKIKLLNSTARVLLYWNAALHYNMYECESAVQRSWLIDAGGQPQLLYNYTIADFRAWWVSCAVDALRNSSGALDGVFIDAAPKLSRFQDNPAAIVYAQFARMLDDIRAAVPGAFIVFNGNYNEPSGRVLANATELLPHADAVYAESMAHLDSQTAAARPDLSIAYLKFLAASSAAAAVGKHFIAHGPLDPSDAGRSFTFGLALFLLVTPNPSTGWFLANDGYSVNQGLMVPHPEYAFAYGAPRGPFSVNGTVLFRTFDNATVAVDLIKRNATIVMGPPYQLPPSQTASPAVFSSSTQTAPPAVSTSPTPTASPIVTLSLTPRATNASSLLTPAPFSEYESLVVWTTGVRVGVALGVLLLAGVVIAVLLRVRAQSRRLAKLAEHSHTEAAVSTAVITNNPLAFFRFRDSKRWLFFNNAKVAVSATPPAGGGPRDAC